jgi:hypothetical protein
MKRALSSKEILKGNFQQCFRIISLGQIKCGGGQGRLSLGEGREGE